MAVTLVTSAKRSSALPAAPGRPARRRAIGLAPLRGFEAAARHLSFTLAAEELHLTQSAISRQVGALEADLGHRLFVRKTRALALTADGERLLRSVRGALGGIDRTVDEIRGQTSSQRVAVTTYASFASLWLVPRLAAFQRAHPGIELHINADGRRLNLEAEGIDIALRRCPPADAPAGAVRLFEEDVTPALSQELLDRHGGRLQSPADLLELPLIEVEDDLPGQMSSVWARWFEHAGADAEAATRSRAPVMVVAYIDQSMQAAARGQGVVLARKPFREEMVAARSLVLPFAQHRLPTGYSTYLVVSRSARNRKPVGQLRDWLLQEFARSTAPNG
jgi:LysR family glycine cleavage system transcriptional activator